MQNLPIYFVSGFPRSGSTLLMNILAQNDKFHVTPTSGVVDMLFQVRNSWNKNIYFKAQGIKTIQPRIESMMRNMIYGFYEDEFNEEKIVFDKNRMWPQYIEMLEQILMKQVKIIMTIRDLKNVLASFEMVHRKSSMTKFLPENEAFFDCQTMEGRAYHLLHKSASVGSAINQVRDAINRNLSDRLIFVKYKDLTHNPKGTMDSLHEMLYLEEFEYDFDNIAQITQENDSVYGMELHSIKKKVKPCNEENWKEILTLELGEEIDRKYADIQQLVN